MNKTVEMTFSSDFEHLSNDNGCIFLGVTTIFPKRKGASVNSIGEKKRLFPQRDGN